MDRMVSDNEVIRSSKVNKESGIASEQCLGQPHFNENGSGGHKQALPAGLSESKKKL